MPGERAGTNATPGGAIPAEGVASEWPKYPLREKSALGVPKPMTSIERTCQRCGASFLGLAPGRTGEIGWWDEWRWFCSIECRDGTGLVAAFVRPIR